MLNNSKCKLFSPTFFISLFEDSTILHSLLSHFPVDCLGNGSRQGLMWFPWEKDVGNHVCLL